MDFESKWQLVMGIVLGLGMIGGGLFVRHVQAREEALLVEVTGTVVDNAAYKRADFATGKEVVEFAPVVEFDAGGGKPARFKDGYQSYRSAVGAQVVVRFDPRDAVKSARVVEPLEGLTAWGMFAMGGFVVFGAVWTGRRR